MSIESAKAYIERMKTDEEFRNKVLACKTPEERMKLVKAEGFDFTKADIKVVASVLDDKELEAAAGGGAKEDFQKVWCLVGILVLLPS